MFSRGSRAAGRHARDDRSRREQARGRRSLADELAVAGELDDPGAAPGPPEPAGGMARPAELALAGPYDISEAPPGVTRLDLGSLKIPSVPGVEVRVQANQDGQVTQVYLVHGESALQLGVFAAPRSEPIWDEVRAEIHRSLFADGVAAEEVAGEYGIELRARVRTQQGLKDLRFVGVDGPRWLARAVYQGPAAVDPDHAGPLAQCLRGVVVDRGAEAKPVKEPLPLRLSTELAERVRSAPGGAEAAPAGAPAGAPGGAGSTNGTRLVNGAGPADPPRVGAPGWDGAPPDGDGLPPPRRKPSPRPHRRD